MLKTNQRQTSLYNWIMFVTMIIAGLCFSGHAFADAAGSSQNIGAVAQNVTNTFANVAQLMTAIGYIAGIGFAIAAIMKFKAHKDNPAQIPIGTPFVLLFVAVALMFLPYLIKSAGVTVFGTNATTVGTTGISTI